MPPLATADRTPVKKTKRTARQDMKAYFKYVMEDYANHPTTQTAYVANAKALVSEAVWNKILTDELVVQAHADWVATAAAGTDYAAVTYLVNRISYAYHTHAALEIDDVVLYSSPHDQPPRGDYLGAATKADWVACMATLEALKTVLRGGPFPPAAQCGAFMGFGEGKPTPESLQGQLLWYLSALKRYRPDIARVYGFKVEGKKLFLASLNPCGVRFSETSDDGELAFWIAHIVLLYDAYLTRDKSLSIRAAEDAYLRWDLSVATESAPAETITVVPFNASHCPGRMTWLALQLSGDASRFASFYQNPASGFLKISWQDVTSVFSERQLLDIAHGIAQPETGGNGVAVLKPDGAIALDQVDWLPGLVRHWPQSCRRDPPELAINGAVDDIEISRVKETIHLASLGQPLSQCERPSHLISVICDAIATHRLMLKHKIIHRDVSWYNLLCKPWHHPATGARIPDHFASVAYILTGTKTHPSSLLVDLDHGALTTILYSDTYKHRKQRTGTPMFVSLELSSATARKYRCTAQDFEALIPKLRAIETRGDLFARAFPDDDGSFVRGLERVLAEEKARGTRAATNPRTPHRPRHDVESFYWVLLWAFSRACPKGSDPAGSDVPPDDLRWYSRFVNIMLGHEAHDESGRITYLMNLDNCESLLHPRLARFANLLEDMATYLSVPWHLYDDFLPEDHAHIAMIRLLVMELDALGESLEQDLAFDTFQPRIAEVIENAVLTRSMQPTGTGLMSAVMAAVLIDRDQRKTRTQPPRGLKRKTEDEPQYNDAVITPAQCKRVMRKLADQAPEPVERKPSAADLVRMIFDDRLWFGVGTRAAQERLDVEAAQ